MAILTLDKIKEQALRVLEKELMPLTQEFIQISNKEGRSYAFRRYDDGWDLVDKDNKKVLAENLTDEEMFAHLKLLRG